MPTIDTSCVETRTSFVAELVRPSCVVTRSQTTYCPSVSNRCDGQTSADVVPSPKSHSRAAMPTRAGSNEKSYGRTMSSVDGESGATTKLATGSGTTSACSDRPSSGRGATAALTRAQLGRRAKRRGRTSGETSVAPPRSGNAHQGTLNDPRCRQESANSALIRGLSLVRERCYGRHTPLPPAPVDFHLLGPLEAVAAGEALPLGGPKQRARLALLLIHTGEVVSTDTLIDELWGASPPRTAPAYVQNCVSRLRKVLGPELLETRPPGYALHAPPATIDARRFEQIVHDARGLAAGERAGALREALALWRGAALADLAFETFAQTEARRLEELRVAALEDRIEAELELGLHAELVGELEGLAREHPARERLRRLQMLALYRSGRQVDALAAYQEARLALDELGLEPSEEL